MIVPYALGAEPELANVSDSGSVLHTSASRSVDSGS